jgi:RGM family protein
VTLIIKGHDECAHGDYVTFQAPDVHGALPSTFDDGRSHLGPQRSVRVTDVVPGEHVNITLRFVDTHVIIRRYGEYFSVTLSLPAALVREARPTQSLQLCRGGCPAAERVSLSDLLSTRPVRYSSLPTDQPAAVTIRMSREAAQERCRLADVVDSYLDSCVFDLLSTGDANLTRMAAAAMRDAVRLLPSEIARFRNRTAIDAEEPRSSASSSTPHYLDVNRTLWLFLLLFCLLEAVA